LACLRFSCLMRRWWIVVEHQPMLHQRSFIEKAIANRLTCGQLESFSIPLSADSFLS